MIALSLVAVGPPRETEVSRSIAAAPGFAAERSVEQFANSTVAIAPGSATSWITRFGAQRATAGRTAGTAVPDATPAWSGCPLAVTHGALSVGVTSTWTHVAAPPHPVRMI